MSDSKRCVWTKFLLCATVCVMGDWPVYAQTPSDAARNREKVNELSQAFAAARHEVSIAPSAPDRFPESWYPPADTPPEMAGPVTGKPFQTVEVSASSEAGLSEKIEPNEQVTKMRDSDGRTRTESISGAASSGDVSYLVKTIQVSDPVAHCAFRWDAPVAAEATSDLVQKVAFVQCAPRTIIYVSLDMFGFVLTSPHEGSAAIHGTINDEDYLGVRSTYSAVSASRSQTTGRETWYSSDLQLTLAVFELRGDPDHGGTRVQNLVQTGLKRVEPDPALFYPPADYRIKVEAAK